VSADQVVFSLSKEAPPVVRVQPGEKVVLETADCFSGQVRSADAVIGNVDWTHVNPASGPVYVEGAQPGDVLAVTIEGLGVVSPGVMAVSDDFGVLSRHFDGMSFQLVGFDGEKATVSGGSVPIKPMIGVIGVAPAGDPIPCGSPGPHGGNMDTTLIGHGATVYLPVFVPGALLAAGDLHAAMGDGEICGTGVEVAGRVTLVVDVHRDLTLVNPAVENGDVVATIASAETLDEAAELATRDMADLLMSRLGLSPADATMLMSAAGQLQVSQVVDPLKTARFAFAKEVIAPLGRLL